jgi:SEN1 N terminal
MNHSVSAIPLPSGLDAVLDQISQSYTSPDHEALTEASILTSLTFLQELPQEVHWLCNSSPLLPLVVQAVQLWGYGETPAQTTLSKFKPVLSAALARCSDCALEWHRAVRRELRHVFIEIYSYDEISTTEFFEALANWDVERLSAGLENALQFAERVPMGWKHNEIRSPFIECLAESSVLLNEGVLKRWKNLLRVLDKFPSGLGESWLPGALVLLFESEPRANELGKQMFKNRGSKIRVPEFETDLRKSLLQLLGREIQNVYH